MAEIHVTDGWEYDKDWAASGNCRDGDPDAMFVEGAEQNVAKRICRGCPVITDCLADALDTRTEHGVWGGKTELERRALLRQYPNVASWKQLFGAYATSIAQAKIESDTAA